LLPRTGSSPTKHVVAVSAALGASCGILQSMTALPTLPFPFSPEYLLTGAETPGLVQLQYLAYFVAFMILVWAFLIGRRLDLRALGGRALAYAFLGAIPACVLGELYWYWYLFTGGFCSSSGCSSFGFWTISATALNLISYPLLAFTATFLGFLSKKGTLEFSSRGRAAGTIVWSGAIGFVFPFLTGVAAIAGFWDTFTSTEGFQPLLPSPLPESVWILLMLALPLVFAAIMYLSGERLDLQKVGVVVFLSMVIGALVGYFAAGYGYPGIAFPDASALEKAFTVTPKNFFQSSTGWPILFSPYTWKYSNVPNCSLPLLGYGFTAACLGYLRRSRA